VYRRAVVIPIQAFSDEQRTAPLFLVFWQSGAWCVCPVNLEGDPVHVHEAHQSLKLATDQAEQLNRWNTEPPPEKAETLFEHGMRWLKERFGTACCGGRAK